MSIELDSVVRRIRSLINMNQSNGCSEGAAMNAASKIGLLLQQYNLTMDKVFLGEQKCITGTVTQDRKQRHPVAGCVIDISNFCDCKVWTSSPWREKQTSYHFFGLETDVEMAKYLFQTIVNAMDTEVVNFKQSEIYLDGYDSKKRLSTSFLRGMASRISAQLRDMTDRRHKDESKATVHEGVGECTDIVLIKRDKVEDEFSKLGLRLRSKQSYSSRTNFNAYDEGYEAGGKVNLNRPLTNRTGVSGYLE